MSDSFPRQQARTRRFTLGVPRAFTVSPDGTRVIFLRTKGGEDPVTCLWEVDAASGTERLVADPADLGADEANLPPEERARRERVRETAGGIVSYATDATASVAVFPLAGQVYAVRLGGEAGTGGGTAGTAGTTGTDPAPWRVSTRTPALDPRPDPTGTKVAYVHNGALRVAPLEDTADGSDDREIAAEPGVTYGLAEFVAAEEMHRTDGYWWSPDGTEILAARVDESGIQRWYIADPANPDRPARGVAYPAAGTPNAKVTLHRVAADGSSRSQVELGDYEYLVTASWDSHGPLVVTQSRDQKHMRVLGAEVEATDQHWTDILPGVPARTAAGDLVWTVHDADTCRLTVKGQPVTPPGLQVRAVLDLDADTILFTASAEPTEIGLWSYSPDAGLTEVLTTPGVHSGRRSGGTTLTISRDLEGDGTSVTINNKISIPSLALRPSLVTPSPVIFAAGEREIRTAVLFPSDHKPGTKLPVLLDPYGGPHAQRVLAARGAYHTSQWFAEQGYAVVIADGRGTPGRGPAWDRAVAGDLAGPVLADQIEALLVAAVRFADLDLSRVAIRGWSFGGYLAALAVLRRPDIFHAAIAGAPVTDWRLYDTHYTERYLGVSTEDAAYEQSSLRPESPVWPEKPVRRPLLFVHGLADDNVVVAHTLRLSSALLAAGYPHSVLPLSGVTHMTSQEVVAENLLLLQAHFLHEALNRT
jgi:dipeptidyl-peptidase-4